MNRTLKRMALAFLATWALMAFFDWFGAHVNSDAMADVYRHYPELTRVTF